MWPATFHATSTFCFHTIFLSRECTSLVERFLLHKKTPHYVVLINADSAIQVLDIDSNKPFAIVLPINAGTITFYDVNGNTVEYWNNSL